MRKRGTAEAGRSGKLPGLFLWAGMAVALMIPVTALSADTRPPLQYGRNPEIQQIKPKKPVSIRLHRNAKGEYSWDLTGDNADEVIKADARLRRLLRTEPKESLKTKEE
ncbi:MAG: hypothetical protein WC291_01345 [Thermodesulfovibrionales bacterium]